MRISAPSDCELCHELELDGRAVTGSSWSGAPPQPFSRLVLRTAVIDVISGLGSLSPGYTLLIPRRHVASVGELDPAERDHVFAIGGLVAEQIKAEFGCEVVMVEHGSSGKEGEHGGACITHSHIHLFPVPRRLDPAVFVPPGSHHVPDYDALTAVAAQRRNYYFCTWFQPGGYFMADPHLPSQYARQVWAHSLHEPDRWDWAAFPYFDNCRLTSERLRRDEAYMGGPTDAPALRETLEAYTAYADWYADRTRDFPAGSTLPQEMDELLAGTSGPIVDAGAGAGRDAAYLANSGRPVVALDACAPLLRHAPEQPGLGRVAGDIRALPLGDGAVGAVWCSAALLHLSRHDVLRSLREFFRVLAPGGLMQISVKEGQGTLLEPMANEGSHVRHFFLYDFEDLNTLSADAGLEVVTKWSEEERDVSKTLQRWIKVLLRKPW